MTVPPDPGIQEKHDRPMSGVVYAPEGHFVGFPMVAHREHAANLCVWCRLPWAAHRMRHSADPSRWAICRFDFRMLT